MKYLHPAVIVAFAVIGTLTVHAQETVTLVATGGIRASIEPLIQGFESKTGYGVRATFDSVVFAYDQVMHGGTFDVVIMPFYPDVVASGNVVADPKTLASVALGVAVRKGASKPDISTPAAVKEMLLSAKSITANTGYEGLSFEETLKKLGIADQMRSKMKRAHGGSGVLIKMVANGEAEIGFTTMSELVSGGGGQQGFPPNEGIEVVGPLPKEISDPLTFVGFVSSHAKNPAAATAFLAYISSPEAASVYKAHGMQPHPAVRGIGLSIALQEEFGFQNGKPKPSVVPK